MSKAANPEMHVLLRLAKHRPALIIRAAATSAFIILTLYVLAPTATNAQVPDDIDSYPPPLRILAKEEKNLLNAENDPKRHTFLALQLTDAHLTKAEELNAHGDFVQMYSELGEFNAVIDELLQFLTRHDDGGRILNSYKKLEIGLRSYSPRLETIRRDLPSNYEPYVKKLIKIIRDARSKAVEPFFGTSVVPQKDS
jgi:hypothetical protein